MDVNAITILPQNRMEELMLLQFFRKIAWKNLTVNKTVC